MTPGVRADGVSGIGRLVGGTGGVAAARRSVDRSLARGLQVVDGRLSLMVGQSGCFCNLCCRLRAILHGLQGRVIILLRHDGSTLLRYRVASAVAETRLLRAIMYY